LASVSLPKTEDSFMSSSFLAALASFAFGAQLRAAPLDPVDTLDLDRYDGIWHEIASLPQAFQLGCACTTATYTRQDDGSLKVVNECRRYGFHTLAEGRAVRE